MNTSERRQVILDWLGLEEHQLCDGCGGRGRRAYPSTATWRGGVGGQMVTGDVCDRCWGTGRNDRTGVDLRRVEVVDRGACDCGAPALFLCDQPLRLAHGQKLGPGAPATTCSAPLCKDCRTRTGTTFFCGEEGEADTVDLCPLHVRMQRLGVR